ncbi:MAG: hypothetical protein KBB11_04045 [Bacteroidales bacterium]|jgi:esterase/lipase|nr:hypothetical protein [Bacteroidales bacterium]HOY38490.1 hypothetical protein [Bacteroidales bacterium]HQP03597.1 hypothetical protein [Bacteroidales bacterium]
MKTLFTIPFIFLALLGTAQNVTEGEAIISGVKQNAIIATIPKADVEVISKEWKNLMKKYDAEVTGKDELFANNAVIKSITDNSMDVYARFEVNKDKDVVMSVAFDLGGFYMNSSAQPELFKEAKKFVQKFAESQSKSAYKETVKAEQKVLSGMEKEKKKLEKANEKLEKKNEDMRNQIKENSQAIKENQAQIDNKIKEIETQENKVKALKKDKP